MRLITRSNVKLFLLSTFIVMTGLTCKACPEAPEVAARLQPFTLKYWRVNFDGQDAFDAQFNAFRATHPHISIDYRTFTFDEYQRAILNALAENNGPDIISLQANWMREWQPYLLPAPASLSIPFREVRSGIRDEVVTVVRNIAGPSPRSVANDFVDTVTEDVVLPVEQADNTYVGQVFGLPLAVDTMVLYYNKDILNRSGIALPATDWRTFQEQVKTITKLDQNGTIIQSAAALGSADNVDRASDILALLMMQNGAPMTDANGTVTFDKYPPELAGRPYPPGAEALIFYSDFSNPEKEVYTWNDKMPNSLLAFERGQTAFFFGYSYHLPLIRRDVPQLNFGIAPFPQIENNKPIYYANYWVEAVTKDTEHPDEAWNLVQFLTGKEQAEKYLAVSRRPTALRSLVSTQLEDLNLNVFAQQVPAAKNWYHGTNATATEEAFDEMIRQMLAGEADPKRIVELGATKVNQTIQ